MTAWDAADDVHGVQLEPGATRSGPGVAWLTEGLTMSETAQVNSVDRMIAASCAAALGGIDALVFTAAGIGDAAWLGRGGPR